MARPLRLAYPGAFYHVFARGNNRQTVFHGADDCELFFDVFGAAVDRYGWLCHTYCLMGNHYHLLVETLGRASRAECARSTCSTRAASTAGTGAADTSSRRASVPSWSSRNRAF
jgi:REP element-mobilizing transposase RayT